MQANNFFQLLVYCFIKNKENNHCIKKSYFIKCFLIDAAFFATLVLVSPHAKDPHSVVRLIPSVGFLPAQE